MENEIKIWKIAKETAKEFPVQYVLDKEDGEGDFEIGDNIDTEKLFEQYDYLELTSDGRLYGIKDNTSYDIIIDDRVPFTDDEISEINKIYEEVD